MPSRLCLFAELQKRGQFRCDASSKKQIACAQALKTHRFPSYALRHAPDTKPRIRNPKLSHGRLSMCAELAGMLPPTPPCFEVHRVLLMGVGSGSRKAPKKLPAICKERSAAVQPTSPHDLDLPSPPCPQKSDRLNPSR